MKALLTGRLVRGKDREWVARVHLANGQVIRRVCPSAYSGRRVFRCVTREALRISAWGMR